MSFIFLYGSPGSGKTTLAASMTNLGLKVEFIDIDGKVDKMANLKPLVTKGLIKAITLKSPLVEGTLRQRVTLLRSTTSKRTLVKMPQGFLEFCDIIDNYEKDASAGHKRKGWVLAVDSLTRLQEHMKRFLLFVEDKNKFTFDQWDIWKTNLEELIARLQGLDGYFDHVIVTAHEQAEYSEDGAIIAYRPMIDGSMKYKTGSYFEEMYYTYIKNVPGSPPRFMVRTVSDGKREARTSRNLTVDAPADFAELFSTSKGGSHAKTTSKPGTTRVAEAAEATETAVESQ